MMDLDGTRRDGIIVRRRLLMYGGSDLLGSVFLLSFGVG